MKTSPITRRRPMRPAELAGFQSAVVDILLVQSRDTRYLADEFKVTIAAMSKRLTDMQLVGLIHSECVRGNGRQVPFTWHSGYGAPIVRERKVSDKLIPGGVPKQLRVTKWPPVKIPKQGIFAALGL